MKTTKKGNAATWNATLQSYICTRTLMNFSLPRLHVEMTNFTEKVFRGNMKGIKVVHVDKIQFWIPLMVRRGF